MQLEQWKRGKLSGNEERCQSATTPTILGPKKHRDENEREKKKPRTVLRVSVFEPVFLQKFPLKSRKKRSKIVVLHPYRGGKLWYCDPFRMSWPCFYASWLHVSSCFIKIGAKLMSERGKEAYFSSFSIFITQRLGPRRVGMLETF